jgi:single-strand DNA-binding protein
MADLKLPYLNRVTLAGRLTRDAEIRVTPSGSRVADFALAVNRRYRDPAGRWQDDTLFIDAAGWDRVAEAMERRGRKGAAVVVEGRLQSRSFETREGVRKTVIEVRAFEVQFLDRAGEGSRESGPGDANEEESGPAPAGDGDLEF